MIHWMLVRHAKSDWSDGTLSDAQRPLNQRGKKAAQQLGEKILTEGLLPERILCSTALRTVQTLQGMLQIFSQYSLSPVPEILYLQELYLATPTTIQQIVAQNHGNKTKVMCIGHNPGIENLASELANKNLEMKTAHLIVFERETDWANASQIGKGWKLLRNLRGEDS